jgi:hypothetical protein
MKIFRYFILILAACISSSLFAQENQKSLNELMKSRGEYYFSLTVQNPTEIQTINELCSVDGTDGKTVMCYANQRQFDQLLKQGYQPLLITPPSMRQIPKMWDGNQRESYEWDSYLTYPEYESMMQQFGTDYPERCTYLELGTLASGRKMMGVRLNNGNGDGKPHFLYTSTMHGDEVTGMILMLRLINEFCTSNDSRILNILNNVDLFIFPCTNPDGTYHGGNNTVYGATRYNADGVDLNRHFPDFDKGPHPDGENQYQDEAQWMMDIAQEYLYTMSANYHGGAEVMNYPWDTYQPLHPDDEWWQLVCHEYADLTHELNPSYMDDYNNGIINGYSWYTISGSRQDYMNYFAQCREVTIECSNDKTPSANQLPFFWNYNHNSMLAYIEQSLNGIHGTITDSATGQPLVATVTIENHDHHGSSVTSHMPAGDYHRVIKGGTYQVTYSAPGYYPQTISVTVADGQSVVQNVQLVAGEGIIPDFTADITDLSLGGSVNFHDNTWGAYLVSWQWSFPGGTPSSSTEQNPTGITYNAIGSYPVTLTVTNQQGQSQSITKSDYIRVSESYYMQDGTIQTCDALFYDDGGPQNSYSDRKDYILTFTPGNPSAMLQVSFVEFSLENDYDYLYIYDGTSISAPSLGSFTGFDSPGTLIASNDAGALTFRFKSDYSVNYPGWKATITCVGGDPEPLTVTAFAEEETIHEGNSTQLTAVVNGGVGPYTYHWEPAESLNNATIANPIATPALPTEYLVTVTDSEGETAEATVFVDVDDVNVSENGFAKVKVYPIPTDGVLHLDGITGETHYRLLNSLGQVVVSGTCNNDVVIDTKLPAGVYFLRLSNGTESSTLKITVK